MSGCLLDALEKTCGEKPEARLQTLNSTLLDMQAMESAFLCCCPTPYVSCSQAEVSPTCLQTLASTKAQLEKEGADPVKLLQQARIVLLSAEDDAAALNFAPAEPYAECSRGFGARKDLFCEMLVWQYTELGDGNEVSGCLIRFFWMPPRSIVLVEVC